MASASAPSTLPSSQPAATPSYVFKLKYTASTSSAQEETRRYGFRGDLRQRDVFTGLAHRAAQVFGLSQEEFYLTSARRNVRGEGEEQVGLETYETFLSDVCEPLLEMDRSGGLRKDEKGRIVIVFYVTRKEVGEQDAEIKEALARSQVTNAEEQQTRREDRYLATQKEAHARAVSATHRPLFDQQLSRDNAYGWDAPPPPPPQLHLSSLRAGSTSARKEDPMPALEPTAPVASVTVEPIPVFEAQKASFGSVKEILTKFVSDLNSHLADNFGDEAGGFKLNLPTSDVEEKKVEEKKVPVVYDSSYTCFCDRCLRTITGPRNTCLDCPNYDLCSACIPMATTFHAAHSFQLVGTSTPVVATKVSEQDVKAVVQHAATCDLCNKGPILGTRWKCLNCPDFDVCTSCHELVPTLHPHHNFVPLTTLTSLRLQPSALTVHPHIKCDECGVSPIMGIRYHCLEEQCRDYDICMNCEADPVERHDRSHVLARIRVPTTGRRLEEVRGRVGVLAQQKKEEEKVVVVEKKVEEKSEGVSDFEMRLRMFLGGHKADEDEGALVDEEKLVKDTVEVGSTVEPKSVHSTFGATPILFSNPTSEPYSYDELVAAAEAEPIVPQVQLKELDAIFISDITLVDGSVVPAGGEFNKIWRVLNNGSLPWPLGTQLVHVSGFSSLSSTPLRAHDAPTASPSEIVELICELKAPEESGRHMDHWRLSTPDGTRFGHRLWIDITVEEEGRENGGEGEGSNLSSSIVTPSLTLAGRTAPTTEDGTVRSIEEDEMVSEGTSEESMHEEEEEDFVVLSEGESSGTTSDGESESESEDEEWRRD